MEGGDEEEVGFERSHQAENRIGEDSSSVLVRAEWEMRVAEHRCATVVELTGCGDRLQINVTTCELMSIGMYLV